MQCSLYQKFIKSNYAFTKTSPASDGFLAETEPEKQLPVQWKPFGLPAEITRFGKSLLP